MRRRGALTSAVAIALAAALAALVFAPEMTAGKNRRYKQVTSHRIGRGARLTTIRDPAGPWVIHVISINLSRRSTIDVALAQDMLPGFETTSSMARRHGAIAAINGDYALESGRPVYTFAEDGHLAQTTTQWGSNFAVNRAETATYIGHPQVSTWARELNARVGHRVNRVNQGPPRYRRVAQFTPAAGYLEQAPRDSCSARLLPLETPRARSSGKSGVRAVHAVDKVRCAWRRMARRGGVVLSAVDRGPRSPEVSRLRRSDHLVLGWSLGWPGVFDSIGGNPTLIEDGRIAVEFENVPFFWRHPRTGVGTTPDGKVLFVTVDGRQPGYSVGMTPGEFARLFRSLGADWALNLDGGGSTTMVVRGDVRNRPSDGQERPVSSALLLLARWDAGEKPSPPAPRPSPTSRPPLPVPTINPSKRYRPGASPWELIVSDPASTGGLAAWLAATGRSLAPGLREAATAFERRRQ